MNKAEFLEQLRKGLDKLPETEIEKSVMFYAEMIDDRIEEGQNEAEAVASLGDPATVAASIIEEMPAFPKAIAKSKTGSKALNWTLIIIGSPIWASLGLAALLVVFSVYLVIWSLIITIWALAIGFLLAFPLGIAIFLFQAFAGSFWFGVWELGAGLFLGGLGVFCLYGALKTSTLLIDASRRFGMKISSLFRKEQSYAS